MSSIRDFLIAGLTGNEKLFARPLPNNGKGFNMSNSDLYQFGKGLFAFKGGKERIYL
ncbi:MAG TPA: hypothetical protein VNR61_03000 [Niallia sp.]|nr:hypothetical protein [Niallia sp.]